MCRWLLLSICVGLTACSSVPNVKQIPQKDLSLEIYFVYEKWHTSILIPAASVEQHSRHFADIAKQKRYIRFGWGDGDFFTGKSKTMFTGAKALVASNYSAIQVLDYWQDPFNEIPIESRVMLMISEKHMKKLIQYIDRSVLLDDRKKPIALMAYNDDTGYFFRGQEHYSVLSNCNTWSSRALQVAGLPIRNRLKLTAQSIFEQAKIIGTYQQLHREQISLLHEDLL